MDIKHNGGEPLTACAIGACSAAIPTIGSLTGPAFAALGIGTGVALSRKRRSKKSLKRGGKCKKSLKKRGGVCPNCYDQECEECKIKRQDEELNEEINNKHKETERRRLNKIKLEIRKKEMRKECSNLAKLLEKKKIPLEKRKEYAKKMVINKDYCDIGHIDACNYCKDEYLKNLKTKKGSIMTPKVPDEAKPKQKSTRKSTTRRRQAPNERLHMLTYAAQQTSKRKKTKRDLLDINKSKQRLSRSSSKKKTTNKKKSSIGGKSKRKSKKKGKKKSKKKQRGGNINNIIFILLLFYFMYKQSVNKDFYDIKDIDVGYSDDLILPEEVGLSLIPYTQEVSDAIINYVIGGDFENQAHTLSLDDSGNIEDIKLYFNPYLKELLDFTSKDYERQTYVETYKNRDLGLQHNDRWFDTKIRDYNLPQEGDISKILEVCLPGIHLLTGKIPKKLFMSGTFAKNVNIFNPQWHQDYPGTNRLYPNVADYNIRLMLIPQKHYETKYPELINFSKDTKLTDYATQVDNYKPENRLHPDNIDYTGGPQFNYFTSNIAQKVNLKIDQTKYVGIMFNNYKLFHKSPDVDGFLRSTQRDVIQLQFIFNDKDLITPATDIKQDLGEFNYDIIQNIEDKLDKKNDANIEEILGGMFRN